MVKKIHNEKVNKGINLLSDIQGRELYRTKVFWIYRGLSIVFVFVLIIYSLVGGLSFYSINKVKNLDEKIDNKKIELSNYSDLVNTLNLYAYRVDQISSIRPVGDSRLLKLYDELNKLEQKVGGLVSQYKISGNLVSFNIRLRDTESLYKLEYLVSESLNSKAWNKVMINSITINSQLEYDIGMEVTLGG